MEQIHKRFTAEQVKALIKGYHRGILDRSAIEEILGISKTRFFALLTQYRRDADKFALAYQRSTPTRIPYDASHHRWSPYAKERWVLVTSLDDFSRKLMYADFFKQETTWTHIKAAETLT